MSTTIITAGTLGGDILGAEAIAGGNAMSAYRAGGTTPQCVLSPASVDELRRWMAATDPGGVTVIPAGNGTQLDVGRAPRTYDVALSTRRLRRILAHEVADMTVTVEAGLTLAELNDALRSAAQSLPLDPPHPELTTIGALIAADASGPLRLSQGKVRDLLIGISVVLADGTLVHGGGRVVKNVAGYDLMKLFTGSFGTLGVIVEATFKIRPLPESVAVVVVPTDTGDEAINAALRVLAARVEPSYVEALNRQGAIAAGLSSGPTVIVGCGGTAAEVAVQLQRLEALFGAQVVQVCDAAEGAKLYAAVRDFQRPNGCKVSLLPSKLGGVLDGIKRESARRGLDAAWVAHVGSGVAFVRFAADAAVDAALPSLAEWLHTTVRDAGGWVTFDVAPGVANDRIDPWGIDPPGAELMRGVKRALDPRGRLSPGRFVGGI